MKRIIALLLCLTTLCSGLIISASAEGATVTGSDVNVRSGPGTNYAISGSVKKGDAYTVTEIRYGFGKLKSGAGWISLKYTERT